MPRRRFHKLERNARKPAHAPGAASASAARFQALEPPGARAARGRPETSCELGAAEAGQQPFLRCSRCGGDSHFSATVCSVCDASLTAPEQRLFNERLWERLRQEAAAQEREIAAMRERRGPDPLERHRAELLALTARELERRLQGNAESPDLEAHTGPRAVAAWFLARSPAARWSVLGAALLAAVLLAISPVARWLAGLLVLCTLAAAFGRWLHRIGQ